MKQTKTVRAFTKSVNVEERTVEQIVSVFENVDLGKDRVKTGAFEKSLAQWSASGDPIPAIWSHMWDNPFAHIGEVLEAKELAAGDPLLPEEIAELGGLWVKYRIDDEPFASKVLDLLSKRRVREASFAYDVSEEKKNNDGTTDLVELDLIEVGPTLKGMNPLTQLLSVKSDLVAELVKAGVSETQANAAVAAAAEKVAPPVGTKAVVTIAGSLEETLDRYYGAAVDYARSENIGNGGFYFLHPEGTFPEDDRAIYTVEGWDDPFGAGALFEFHFAADDDGGFTVESIVEVELEATIRPKARKALLRSNARPVVEPAKADDETEVKGLSPGSTKALLDALDLELS